MPGKVLDVAASLISIGAGVYLLTKNGAPVADGQSWFEVIAHGMGAYFIAKGIWMARSLHLQERLLGEDESAFTPRIPEAPERPGR